MYKNAKAEMTRRGLTLSIVASEMKIGVSTLSQKLNGISPITLIEARQFKKIVKTDLPLEELFKEVS